jgi:transcriptional regulator with XRE-family HTH domain
MKESANVGERIKRLREAQAPSQEKFADLVGVSQATVSAWELEDVRPSSESWLRLGNLARYPENLWFWQQAGLDPEKMLSVAGQILKEGGAPAKPDEVFRVSRFRLTPEGREEAGPPLPIAADRVPNPGSAICLVLDEENARPAFSPGDTVALDTTDSDAKSLQSFWKQVILADFAPRRERANHWSTDLWPEGPWIAQLRCKQYDDGTGLAWVATLGPFSDNNSLYRGGGQEIVVGSWRHPDISEEPLQGSPREQISAEIRKIDARLHEIAEEAWKRGPSRQETKEEVQLKKAAADADNRLRDAEKDEREAAREEAATQAPESVRLKSGCRILGRVIAWFPAPGQKK